MVDGIEDPQKGQNTSEAPEIAPKTEEGPPVTAEQSRANYFIGDLDAKLEAEKINLAFVVIIDPSLEQPIVYARGQTYNIARVLAQMSRHFRDQIIKELS